MNVNRKEAPEFRAIDNITLLHPEHTKLANGCNIYCFNSGDQELVRIEWVFGNERFDPTKPLLNVAGNTMLTDGTKTRTAAQIADTIDFYGAFLQAEYGYDNSEVTLFSLNKHLPSTLPIIKDILTNSVFPEREIETYVRNQQQKLQVSLQKNDVVARRNFNRALYGDTIYGFAANMEDYKTLHREDLLTHYRQMYQPSNCTIIIAGKIEQHTLELLKEIFGDSWENTGSQVDKVQPAIQPATEHFYYTEKQDALQSAIRMGMPLINRTHPDFPSLQVLNTVLGGYFGSRLMTNIREDKGYTYGIYSSITPYTNEGSLIIHTEAGRDVLDAAVKEIYYEMQQLCEQEVEEEELLLVKNYLLGGLLGDLDGPFSILQRWRTLILNGFTEEYFQNNIRIYKSITPKQLLDLAQRYYKKEDFYEVVVA
jgi:zinc protease